MPYVDGFVLPVSKKRVGDYRKIARKAGRIWREHGALDYVECVADDVKPGKQTSFPQSVKLQKNETVVFAWIIYKSRAHRDRVGEPFGHRVDDAVGQRNAAELDWGEELGGHGIP